MDNNTKDVLVLLITTLSTLGVAWMKMRTIRNARGDPSLMPPDDPPA